MAFKICAASTVVFSTLLSWALAAPAPRAAVNNDLSIPEVSGTIRDNLQRHIVPFRLMEGRSSSLSSKLQGSHGVITPRSGMDPGIDANAPAAHPDSQIIIPPSATHGEDAR